MFDPNKRIGEDEGPKRPSVMLGIKFDPSKRIGEDEPDGDEVGAPEPDEIMLQAAERLCRIFNVSSSKASVVASLIETICNAADSKPHDEGEHENESEPGEYGKD